MRKIKTEKLTLQAEVIQIDNRCKLFISICERHNGSQPIVFDMPTQCTKQVINDTGMAKHILNYFLKE